MNQMKNRNNVLSINKSSYSRRLAGTRSSNIMLQTVFLQIVLLLLSWSTHNNELNFVVNASSFPPPRPPPPPPPPPPVVTDATRNISDNSNNDNENDTTHNRGIVDHQRKEVRQGEELNRSRRPQKDYFDGFSEDDGRMNTRSHKQRSGNVNVNSSINSSRRRIDDYKDDRRTDVDTDTDADENGDYRRKSYSDNMRNEQRRRYGRDNDDNDDSDDEYYTSNRYDKREGGRGQRRQQEQQLQQPRLYDDDDNNDNEYNERGRRGRRPTQSQEDYSNKRRRKPQSQDEYDEYDDYEYDRRRQHQSTRPRSRPNYNSISDRHRDDLDDISDYDMNRRRELSSNTRRQPPLRLREGGGGGEEEFREKDTERETKTTTTTAPTKKKKSFFSSPFKKLSTDKKNNNDDNKTNLSRKIPFGEGSRNKRDDNDDTNNNMMMMNRNNDKEAPKDDDSNKNDKKSYNPISYQFPSKEILPLPSDDNDETMKNGYGNRPRNNSNNKNKNNSNNYANPRQDAVARYTSTKRGKIKMGLSSSTCGGLIGAFIGKSIGSSGKKSALIFAFLFWFMNTFLRDAYGDMARSLSLGLIFLLSRTRDVRKRYRTGVHVKTICRLGGGGRVPFPPIAKDDEDGDAVENPWKYVPQSEDDPQFDMIKSLISMVLIGSFCGGNVPLIPTWMGSTAGAATLAFMGIGKNARGDLIRTMGMRVVATAGEAIDINSELHVARKVSVVVGKLLDKALILDRKHRIKDKLFSGASWVYGKVSSTVQNVQEDMTKDDEEQVQRQRQGPGSQGNKQEGKRARSIIGR